MSRLQPVAQTWRIIWSGWKYLVGQWSVSTKFYEDEQLILSSWRSLLAVKPLNWCHRYDVCGLRWCQKVLKWNGQIRIMVLVSTERREALHIALCHWCCQCHSFIIPHWPRIFQNHSTCMMSSAVLSQIYEIFRISLWCQCPAVSATAVGQLSSRRVVTALMSTLLSSLMSREPAFSARVVGQLSAGRAEASAAGWE